MDCILRSYSKLGVLEIGCIWIVSGIQEYSLIGETCSISELFYKSYTRKLVVQYFVECNNRCVMVLRDFLQIMTPWCIFPVHAGDKRRPLGNITGLTFKTALESWKYYFVEIWNGTLCASFSELQCSMWWIIGNFVSTHRGMIGHLRPRRRFPGLEYPASHRSSCHGAGCQGMGKSCLKCCH